MFFSVSARRRRFDTVCACGSSSKSDLAFSRAVSSNCSTGWSKRERRPRTGCGLETGQSGLAGDRLDQRGRSARCRLARARRQRGWRKRAPRAANAAIDRARRWKRAKANPAQATKAAAIGLTKAAAAYYAADDIRFNAVSPALVDTPLAARAMGDGTIMQYIATKQPLDGGRVGVPQDLDDAVVFLEFPF